MAGTGRIALVGLDGTLLFTDSAESLAAKEVAGKMLRQSALRKPGKETKHRVYSLAQSRYVETAIPSEMLRNA